MLADPLTKRKHDGEFLRSVLNKGLYALVAEEIAMKHKLSERPARAVAGVATGLVSHLLLKSSNDRSLKSTTKGASHFFDWKSTQCLLSHFSCFVGCPCFRRDLSLNSSLQTTLSFTRVSVYASSSF